VFNILAPIFGLIALAYASRKVNILGPSAYVELNRYVASLALPVLIFDNVAHVTPSHLNQPGFAASFIIGALLVFALPLLFAEDGRAFGDRALDGLSGCYPYDRMARAACSGGPRHQIARGVCRPVRAGGAWVVPCPGRSEQRASLGRGDAPLAVGARFAEASCPARRHRAARGVRLRVGGDVIQRAALSAHGDSPIIEPGGAA
jgi:hypothetical protein